jgi:ribosomal protein L37AE/L43A
MKPTYQKNCENDCFDRDGRRRIGTQYVHIAGRTMWVCEVCSEGLATAAGIPDDARARIKARLMDRIQEGSAGG